MVLDRRGVHIGEPAEAAPFSFQSCEPGDALHAELKAAGVDVDPEVSRMGDPVPPMFWFRDPEGNSLMTVQI